MQAEGVNFKEAVDLLTKDPGKIVISTTNIPDIIVPAFSPYDAHKILEEYQQHERDYQEYWLDRLHNLPNHPDRLAYFESRVREDLGGLQIGYDCETNRMTIPLWSHNGKYLLGFAKRKIPGADNVDLPKYLNPRNTAFVRKRYLFNLNFVPKSAREVIVVEGLLDAVSMQWAGFPNVVATMGTSVTSEQLALLDEFRTVTFLFDGDLPGLNATARLALPTSSLKAHYQTIMLSDKVDPDTLCQSLGYDTARIVEQLKRLPRCTLSRFRANKLDIGAMTTFDRSLLDKLAQQYVDANTKEGWPQYNVVDWVIQAYPIYGPAIKKALLEMKADCNCLPNGTSSFKEERVKAFLREWIKPCRDVRRAHKEASGQ